MLDYLRSLDTNLFWIYHLQLKNSFFDKLMPYFSNPFPYWKNTVIIIAVLVFIFGNKKIRIGILTLAVAIGLTEFISTHILKELFHRLRPYDALMAIPPEKISSFSFPSSHAANISALATIIYFMNRKISYPVVLIAILVCYSRVYLGAHYPFDVIAGMMLGIIVGSTVYLVGNRIKNYFIRENTSQCGSNEPRQTTCC